MRTKLQYSFPYFVNSQVVFNNRVAETLSKNGHDVTLILVAALDGFDTKSVKAPKDVKTYYVNASFGMKAEDFDKELQRNLFEDLPVWDHRQRALLGRASSLFLGSCRKMVENKFLDWISNQKFDLAMAYVLNMCPVGIIHHAKIPTWMWLNSCCIGQQRCDEFQGENQKFCNEFAVCSTLEKVMVNTNDLYDFPKPTLAKIVNIGGVGFQQKDIKPLESKFQEIVDRAKGVILFSFGSVPPSDKMPMSWKMAFINAFKKFPEYQFVWRYVGTDLEDKLPPNVHTFEWLPQSDLLHHSKTKAFITHGGYNSLQEAISAGVPLVLIPLGGDQPRNARLAERHHFTVRIHKSKVSADKVAEALSKVLNDQSYAKNITRLSKMLEKQPVKPSKLLVSWVEFLAEFKTLENLVPAGTKLNFIQYHSLDVIAFLCSIAATLLFIAYKLASIVVKKAYSAISHDKKLKVQ